MKLILGLLCLIISNISCSSFQNKPSSTVEVFYKSICDGKLEDAKRQLSSTVKLHPSVIDLTLQGRNTACKNAGGFKQLEVEDKSIDNNTAGVIGNVVFQNGTNESIQMKLYNENNQWKLAWEIK